MQVTGLGEAFKVPSGPPPGGDEPEELEGIIAKRRFLSSM